MNNIDDKISQCEKDIESLQANLKALKKEKELTGFNWDDFQVGSIFKTNEGGYRIVVESHMYTRVITNERGYNLSLATAALKDRNAKYFRDYGYKKVGIVEDLLVGTFTQKT